jgi:hypothetical protein
MNQFGDATGGSSSVWGGSSGGGGSGGGGALTTVTVTLDALDPVELFDVLPGVHLIRVNPGFYPAPSILFTVSYNNVGGETMLSNVHSQKTPESTGYTILEPSLVGGKIYIQKNTTLYPGPYTATIM